LYLLGAAVLALFASLAVARLGRRSHPIPGWVSASVLVGWVAVATVLVASGGRLSRITTFVLQYVPITAPAAAEVSGDPPEAAATAPTEQLVVSELVTDLLSGGQRWRSAAGSQLVHEAVETLAMLPQPHQTQSFEANGAMYWRYWLAAERLLWTGGESAPDQLRTNLEHSHPNVRAAVAVTLALCGDDTAIPALLDGITNETVYPVQCAMAEAIIELSSPHAMEAVAAAAHALPQGFTPHRLLDAAARQDPSFFISPCKIAARWNCPTLPDLWRPTQSGDTFADLLVSDLNGCPIQLSEAAAKGQLLISFVTGDHCYMCDTFLSGILLPEASQASTYETVLLVLPHTPQRARLYADRFGLLLPDASLRVIADPQNELAARFGIARQYTRHSEWCNPPAAFVLDERLTLRWFHLAQSVMRRATMFPKDL
jgi:hypothetical protein